MSDQSFSTTISVPITPTEAFDAINDPRAWWLDGIEGRTDEVGGQFWHDSPGHHYWRFQVTELTKPERVIWRVLNDSSTNFVADHAEWNDTEVRFEIVERGDGTEIRFTHVGLVPAIECFDACSTGWGHYISDSLRSLLTTGQGQPNAY
jgi:hypothetical protein